MENNFTDKNTVDQAWAMMQATLDQEMPVKKKRRFIWWIPLLIGAIGIGAWMLTYNTAKSKVIQIAPTLVDNQVRNVDDNTVQNKTASTNTKAKKNNLHSNASAKLKIDKPRSNKIAKTKTEIKTTNTTEATASVNTTTEASKASVVPNQNVTSSQKNNLKSEKISIVISDTKISDYSLRDKKSVAKKLAAEKNIKPQANLHAPRVVRLSETLPNLSISELTYEDKSPKMVTADVPRASNWHFDFKTAFLTDFRFKSPSILTELQVSRQLSPRWSLGSGLGLKSQTIDYRSTIDLDENLVSDIFAPEMVGNGAIGQNLESTRYLTFSYLYVPIHVKYNLKNRWVLETGAHYNFLNLLGTYQLDGYSKSGEAGYKNHNHFSFYFASNYKLTKKTALFLQYQHNTQRFAPYRKVVDAHHVGIGLRWKL